MSTKKKNNKGPSTRAKCGKSTNTAGRTRRLQHPGTRVSTTMPPGRRMTPERHHHQPRQSSAGLSPKSCAKERLHRSDRPWGGCKKRFFNDAFNKERPKVSIIAGPVKTEQSFCSEPLQEIPKMRQQAALIQLLEPWTAQHKQWAQCRP